MPRGRLMETFLAGLLERACVRVLERAYTRLRRVVHRHRSCSRGSSHWADAPLRAYIWKTPQETGGGRGREL